MNFYNSMKKIAILSNINIDPLKSFLSIPEMNHYFAGYNQWQTELTNPDSELFNFKPEIIFLHLDAEVIKNYTGDLFSAVEHYQTFFPKVKFLISNFLLPPYSTGTYLNTDKIETNNLNNKLYELQKKLNGIYIFDFNRLITLHGYRLLFSNKFWYLGRIKYTNAGFRFMANELINLINCIDGKTRKVLALDLDNTLWGGIVGEDSWNNLNISEEGTGRIYADFQRNIKNLSEIGILLVLVSKNNEADVKEVFLRNPNMLLQWNDFIVKKINWNNKADNLREIAAELNLGLDSIVFIDDNAFEREMVKMAFPQIAVPNFPDDITELNYWFINDVVYTNFAKNKITSEDSEKTEQYKRNFERDSESKLYSFDEFLKNLNIKIEIKHLDNEIIGRISQLTQKTNQFNLNAKKYDESELKVMMNSNQNKMFSLSYKDKFGNEGITGTAILELKDNIAFLDVFLLSCRILGRKVEYRFLDFITETLKKQSIKILEAKYCNNGKNTQVQEFLIKYGFSTTDKKDFRLIIE